MAPGLENGHSTATTNGHDHQQQGRHASHRTLILDLGDVLFHWSTRDLTALSPSAFHAVVLSPTWGLLECGKVSEDDAISAIAAELGLSCDSIREAIRQCKGTLRVDLELVRSLMELKKELGDGIRVYAMTNIAKNDFVNLKETLQDWSLFDGEFTSFDVGMIKPELGYYSRVLSSLNISDPTSAIFVDDKVVNVTAAQSFGMHGIVFKSAPSLLRQLRNKLFDPIARGQEYLRKNARSHYSQIENGAEIRDIFSQFLIHSELHDSSLISLSTGSASIKEIESELSLATSSARTWNYFIDRPVGTTSTWYVPQPLPDDVDSTSYALLAFHPPTSTATPILTSLLANRSPSDHLIQTYLDPQRPRTCPVVLCNVLRAFYLYGRGNDVSPELAYVARVLRTRAYVHGSAHYFGSEAFLYFLASLLAAHPRDEGLGALVEPLRDALRDRVGRRDDAFAVAARVRACQVMGVWCGSDVAYLKEMQEVDGGWEMGWVCRFGRTGKRIGSRGVVSAFAVKALEAEEKESAGWAK
ncbi:Haloacid dehalogenase-like hydrolase-domain-containing protein [Phaeosphaeria sp. MPI-PUGE-AT-0046c]|nr:Haloacid dehalogenase-like hydrolase-domain-containing protein [Phaeosphaeria sp. MPI-PUGE-AT-0046c]